jgi:formamidase
MHAIRIDRSKPLSAEPHTGHNRYHPDIAPVLEVGEGEEVILETRDAVDGQLSPSSTEAAFANLNAGAIHPLTGPIFVKGVKPGDVLEIEFLDIAPQPTAFSLASHCSLVCLRNLSARTRRLLTSQHLTRARSR